MIWKRKKKNHTSEIQTTQGEANGYQRRTQKTMSRSYLLSNGSTPKADLNQLISSTLTAKGLLATLSTADTSLWIQKYSTTPPEHLRILLQEVMGEIWKMETTLSNMRLVELVKNV
jgi:hypothetical protein